MQGKRLAMAKGNRYRFALILSAMFIFFQASLVIGSEYRIGPDDILQVTFWQDNNLNTTVRVNQEGKITLDVIGEVQASGKTTTELQDEIVRLMSRLKKDISQVVVRITAYNYNYVFVNGQVLTPGKKTFEEIPDLWTIINESGGVTTTGDLSRVTIIRGGEEAGKVEIVNVRKAIAEGKIDQLPKIRRGDTIDIPTSPGGIPNTNISQQVEQKNLIYVIGAVTKPGPVTFEANTDFTDILALAGGPTSNADLKHVKILTKDGSYSQSYQFNLEKYTENGKPTRYVLRNEDTFVVPERKTGFFGGGLSVGTIAAFASTLTTIYLLVDRLKNNNNTNSGITQ
jgi:protein involved in polysaccharide export with SLBB domain